SILRFHRLHRCFFCVICGWIRLPKIDLILHLDPLLASHAFANLFRERKRIFGARILTFSDDEVRVYRRDDCTAASPSLHSHLINDLAGSDRARRWVLEEATSGTRTVRLSRQSTALRIIHTHLNLFGIVRLQTQRRAEQQLTFAKRSMTIVPLDTVAGNLDHLAFASHAHLFSYGSDLVIESTGIHPERATNCAGNAAESLDT